MIRPTARGIGFTLVVLAVYFFAGQTQIGWLYVLVSGGFAWLVLSVVLSVWAIQGLRLGRGLELPGGRPPVEDEPLHVRIHLDNPGRMTRRFLRLIDECPVAPPDQRQVALVVPRLPAGRTVTGYDVTCYLRGVYHWPAVRVESDGPLGLFRATRWIDAPTSATILPPARAIAGILAGSRAEPAPARRPRRGPGLDLFGTRQYQQGDSLHQVHWRSTARHREIVVRDYEEPRQPSLAIWIDNAVSFGVGRDSTIEYAVKLAASLGVWALGAGYTVILIDRRAAVPCQSPLHVRQVLARLTLAPEAADWPHSVEGRRATVAVALRPAGALAPPPDIPATVLARALVRLAGFPGQPLPAGGARVVSGLERPDVTEHRFPGQPHAAGEAPTFDVRPDADMARAAAAIAQVLVGAEGPRGLRVRP